jgi:(S)-citramalyl-CoA lyase
MTGTVMPIAAARSLLFVPGDRSERFPKAQASGADLVCMDWEDAVAPAARAQVRSTVLAFLSQQSAGHVCGVRINALSSTDGLRDVLALCDAPPSAAPAFVMLAKTGNAAQVLLLADHLPGVPLIALIESAEGLHNAASIAAAHPQLAALMMGGADLAAELQCDLAWEPLLHARSSLVLAAAAAGVAAIDVPWLDVANVDGARAEAQRVAALGFSGKAAIHPTQIAAIHDGLRPSDAASQQARRVVQVAQQAASMGSAALLLEGRLIDRPVVLAAQRLLRRAGLHE